MTGGGLALRIKSPSETWLVRVARGSAVVGRATDCAIAIDDQSLSRRHFKITWDGEVCQVMDLDSRNGLLVNGRPVREAIVHPGDELTAGVIILRLEAAGGRLVEPEAARADVEGPADVIPRPLFESTVPTLSPTAEPAPPGTLLYSLVTLLGEDSTSSTYALIDGAQAFDLAFSGRLMGHDLYTVFSGRLAEISIQVGPCLVALGDPSAFLALWVERIGGHAGVLLQSSADRASVLAHLRHVFIASDESGEEYSFRFYDPRVLRAFLPTCTEAELQEFFGPVTRWVSESADGTGFVAYALEDGKLVQRQIASNPANNPGRAS